MDKEEGGGGFKISTEMEIFLVAIVLIALILWSGVLSNFPSIVNPIVHFFTDTKNASGLTGVMKTVIGYTSGLSIPVSLMLLIGIVISVERLKRIRKKEHDVLYPKINGGETASIVASAPAQQNPDNIIRWRKILALVDSQNQNDWRQAIIESDIILDEILTKMSYHGDDLGGKLMGATKADFRTLDQAWEAHKIRNIIAHEGSAFILNQHEAKRVVGLYRQVFEEFFYI